jgi:hypothetical protein
MKYKNIREEDLKNKVGSDENSPSQRGLGGVELTPAYLQSHNIPTENLISQKTSCHTIPN